MKQLKISHILNHDKHDIVVFLCKEKTLTKKFMELPIKNNSKMSWIFYARKKVNVFCCKKLTTNTY